MLDTNTGEEFTLNPDGTIIGRSENTGVCLRENNFVSRRHAVIKKVGDAWIIEDLNSRHGTAVNGRQINGLHRLSSRDEIWFSTKPVLFLEVDKDQYCGANIQIPASIAG